MELQEILYSQGFGTRRVCAGLAQQGLVQVFERGPHGLPVSCTDAAQQFDPRKYSVNPLLWIEPGVGNRGGLLIREVFG